MTQRRTCGSCSGSLVPARIDASGQSGTYVAHLMDFPIMRCPDDHERWEAYDEFMVNLSEELAYGHSLFTRRSGFLLWQQDACRSCGGAVNERAAASQTTEISLEHGGAPQYRIRVTAPLLACAACGTWQVPDRDEHHLGVSNAIRAAVDQAGIRHQAR